MTNTIMKEARNGVITDIMKQVAEKEQQTPEFIRKGIASGRIIVTKSNNHNIDPLGIGKGLSVKINSNIGTSLYVCDIDMEIEKAKISVKYGADTIMDLSTGKTEADVRHLRNRILNEIPIPLGTVPIYQVALRALKRDKAIIHMTEDDMFNIVEEQAKEGVDYFTIHVGITNQVIDHIKEYPRMMGVVSRGGTFMASWMLHHEAENPYNKNFDYLLEMAQEYDFALSLGDGMRPGAIFDSTDYAQVQELLEISKLVKRARAKDVQVFVEGPGHIPAHQVTANITLQKALCDEAPFYVLGPIVTDIAPGYDHITSAIGGTMAAMAGADFLCYVTPAEHLGLPNLEETKRGIIAAKIAAHAADIVKRPEVALQWDRRMDIARKNLDWEGMYDAAIDPELARKVHERGNVPQADKDKCSMCGDFCALDILEKALAADKKKH